MDVTAAEIVAAPTWQALDAHVIHADCFDVLRTLPAASVDAVVTDPPYGLEFMGAEWDRPWKLGKVSPLGEADGTPFRRKAGAPSWSGSGNPRCRSCGGTKYDRARPTGCRCGSPDFPAEAIPQMHAFQAWVQAWATEALRVLRPGGHMAVFGAPRTFHRLASGIEDAGFEIRDTLMWLFGSGFPKSLNVSKALDRARDDSADVVRVTAALGAAADRAGVSRAAIDVHMGTSDMAGWWTSTLQHRCSCPTWEQWERLADFVGIVGDERSALGDKVQRLNGRKGQPGAAWANADIVAIDRRMNEPSGIVDIGQGERTEVARLLKAPNSDGARAWQGWGTALKPAHEPIVLARKPLAGTVARTVLEHGTGAIHIDACRLATGDGGARDGEASADRRYDRLGGKARFAMTAGQRGGGASGRWPANVLLDEAAAGLLDEQTGTLRSGAEGPDGLGRNVDKFRTAYGTFTGTDRERGVLYGDSGGASRFFYCAKTSRAERDAGLDSLPTGPLRWSSGDASPGTFQSEGTERSVSNHHPTVKPIELMRWLLRLLAPPGGIVLDPFAGSGTTVCAGTLERIAVIGIEREARYVEIARARAAWWAEHPGGTTVEDRLAAERERRRVASDGQLDIVSVLEEANR